MTLAAPVACLALAAVVVWLLAVGAAALVAALHLLRAPRP